MGLGACVSSAASGARAQAGRLGAVLGALCLLPVLMMLARLGAPSARLAASAVQVRAGRDWAEGWAARGSKGLRVGGGGKRGRGLAGWGMAASGLQPRPLRPGLWLVTFFILAVKVTLTRVENPKTHRAQRRGFQHSLNHEPHPVSFSLFSECFQTQVWSRLPPHEPLLSLKGDLAAPNPAGVLATPGPGPLPLQAPRRRRYTLTPARLRWDHFNLTYRCDRGPRCGGERAAAWPPPLTLTPTPGFSPSHGTC